MAISPLSLGALVKRSSCPKEKIKLEKFRAVSRPTILSLLEDAKFEFLSLIDTPPKISSLVSYSPLDHRSQLATNLSSKLPFLEKAPFKLTLITDSALKNLSSRYSQGASAILLTEVNSEDDVGGKSHVLEFG